MTTLQQSFMGFDIPEHARFRRTDPITSIDVATNPAVAKRLRKNGLVVLRTFATAGNEGLNAHEASQRCGLNRYEISRRAAELDARGLLEPTGEKRPLETGHMGLVRRITGVGLLALRGGK